MKLTCSTCATPVVRTQRRGLVERGLLSVVPSVRPYECPACGLRELRWRTRVAPKRLVMFFAAIVIGAALVQLLWFVRTRAPEHPGLGYEPRDMERQKLIEKKEEP